MCALVFPMHAACPALHNLFDLIIKKISEFGLELTLKLTEVFYYTSNS
jgi:hypothetical protein